jgi:hypothetical protein
MKSNRWGRRGKSLFYTILVLALLSCNLFEVITQEEGTSAIGPSTPFVLEGGAPSAPMLTGEDISCSYYVSPSGDDGGPGSESQPWGSFQFAVDTAQPGDTVCFRDGTYQMEEEVYITGSGTAEAPIVFIAYPGERPLVDGGGTVNELFIFNQHASYLRFSGFTLQNYLIWGIELSGENRFVHFDHLEIVGGEAAIHFTYGESSEGPPAEGPVEHITLEDSLIHGSQYSAVDCTPGPCNDMTIRRVEVYGTGLEGEDFYGSDGIEFARGYPVLVEDCYVHDNGGDGIDLNSRDREGHAVDVVVRRNRVIRNHLNGIKLWAGGRIENNIVWGQGNSALWCGTFHSTLEVINNTIAYNMWDPAFSERNWAFVAGYPEEIPSPQVDLLFANNVLAFNTGPGVGDPTGIYLGPGVQVTEHHNLYFSSIDNEITAEFLGMDITRQDLADGSWTDRTGQGQNNLVLDPLFISGWPQVDLLFRPDSPAVDAGDNPSCPAEDYLGNPRPVDGDKDGDAVCDIGAFELQE